MQKDLTIYSDNSESFYMLPALMVCPGHLVIEFVCLFVLLFCPAYNI